MKSYVYLIFFALLLPDACIPDYNKPPKPYQKAFEIVKLDEHRFVHTSYLKMDDGSFVPCNGMIYVNQNEAIILDTPVNDSISDLLINFVKKDLNVKINGVVFTHAHIDAAGGFNAFAKANIPTYAHEKTASFIENDSLKVTHTFTDSQEIAVGDTNVVNRYFGHAHSADNIVSYIPRENTLFGGCQVKEDGAKEGNLKDADTTKWPQSIKAIKEAHPDVTFVVPGHGTYGGPELLDYTIALFSPKSSEGNDIVDLD